MDPEILILCQGLYAEPKDLVSERLSQLEERLERDREQVLDHLARTAPSAGSFHFELLDAMMHRADRWRDVLLSEFERLCSMVEQDPGSARITIEVLDAFSLLADRPNTFMEQFHRQLVARSRTTNIDLAMGMVDIMADHLFKLDGAEMLQEALMRMAANGSPAEVSRKARSALDELRSHSHGPNPDGKHGPITDHDLPELGLRNSTKGNLAFAAFYLLLASTGVWLYLQREATLILVPTGILVGIAIWKVFLAMDRRVKVHIDRFGIRTEKGFTPWNRVDNEQVVTGTSGSTYLQFEELGNTTTLQRIKLDNFGTPIAQIKKAIAECRTAQGTAKT